MAYGLKASSSNPLMQNYITKLGWWAYFKDTE